MSDPRATPLERAFELARSGKYRSVGEVRAQLKLEGLSDEQIYGNSIVKQLRELCIKSTPPAPEET